MFDLDPKLEEFATETQWEKLKLWEEHGTQVKAARAGGFGQGVLSEMWGKVVKKAAAAGYAPDCDVNQPIPLGYHIKGTSTLYGPEGKKLQWVKTDADKLLQQELFREAVQALAEDLPKVEISCDALRGQTSNLLSVYPVGDHHLGMLAWATETGTSYDMKISEGVLKQATAHLVASSPPAASALVVLLGDFFHYDSFEPVTPTARNQLDSDGRYPKMVRVGVKLARFVIEAAARKHGRVNVIVEIGNHDLASSIFLMECLRNLYEGSHNIEIDTSPAHYHYHRFQSVLIGSHHGHGTKMEQLPLIMATDRPEDWGQTTYRYWYTGHIHKKMQQGVQDIQGCLVESFRILAPNDAWARQKGYRSMRSMTRIDIHGEFGEVGRAVVSPDMLAQKGDLL